MEMLIKSHILQLASKTRKMPSLQNIQLDKFNFFFFLNSQNINSINNIQAYKNIINFQLRHSYQNILNLERAYINEVSSIRTKLKTNIITIINIYIIIFGNLDNFHFHKKQVHSRNIS